MDVLIVTGIVLLLGLSLVGLLILLRVFPRLDRLEGRFGGLATREALEEVPARAADRVPAALKEEIARLEGRLDDLRSLVDELARREAPSSGATRIAEEVEPLLREAVESLDARLREIAAARAAPGEYDPVASVARQLGESGYTQVRVVRGPESDGPRTRLTVEARRDGMTYKGQVWLSGARLDETRLSPASPMFP